MSLNYAFAFSLFLLLLVGLNLYFFYALNTTGKKPSPYLVPNVKLDLGPSVFKDIFTYFNYLPNQYKTRNPKFIEKQNYLISLFNSSADSNSKDVLYETEKVSNLVIAL